MNTGTILAELREQRDRLNQAIAALEELQNGVGRRGRRAAISAEGPTRGRGGRRHMSAAARKRISQMMKKRWAERRKARAA